MTDDTDHYPTVREALFGNGHTANVYCAVKFALWHLFHAMFAVTGVVVAVAVVLAILTYRVLRYAGYRVEMALRQFSDVVGVPDRARTTARGTLDGMSATPVTRRVYNYCPVDLKQDPRWFERVAGVGRTVVQAAEPPEYEWVCDGCGHDYSYYPDRDCHWCDDHTEWRKERVEE